jgi:hypothetical protein
VEQAVVQIHAEDWRSLESHYHFISQSWIFFSYETCLFRGERERLGAISRYFEVDVWEGLVGKLSAQEKEENPWNRGWFRT